jgi:hypothetical protein
MYGAITSPTVWGNNEPNRMEELYRTPALARPGVLLSPSTTWHDRGGLRERARDTNGRENRTEEDIAIPLPIPRDRGKFGKGMASHTSPNPTRSWEVWERYGSREACGVRIYIYIYIYMYNF